MPILPVNKGGGSGAEALRYLKDKEGDAHVIMATLNSYYTTPLRTDIGVDIEEFTPLARMAMDTLYCGSTQTATSKHWMITLQP